MNKKMIGYDMIKINNTYIKNPSKYNAYPNLREKSSENSVGDLIRKIISCRRKIELEWDYLSKEEYSLFTDIKFLKEFDCSFINSKGERVTKKMYGGDISADAVNIVDGVPQSYKNIKFNFIQTKADKYTGGAI